MKSLDEHPPSDPGLTPVRPGTKRRYKAFTRLTRRRTKSCHHLETLSAICCKCRNPPPVPTAEMLPFPPAVPTAGRSHPPFFPIMGAPVRTPMKRFIPLLTTYLHARTHTHTHITRVSESTTTVVLFCPYMCICLFVSSITIDFHTRK